MMMPMMPPQGQSFGLNGPTMPQNSAMPPQGMQNPNFTAMMQSQAMPPQQLQPFGPQHFPQPGMESWFPQLGSPANGGNTPLAFRPHLPQGFGFQGGGAESRSPFGFGGY